MPANSTAVATHQTLNRFEVKYLVATRRVPGLLAELGGYLQRDSHWEDDWGYSLSSVYWDTPDLRFFWEKIEGMKFRRKLRFRRYGQTPDVFVEVKQREDRTLQKRRVRWPLEQVEAVFGQGDGGVRFAAAAGDTVATEVALLIERYRLRPTMAIRYRRRAFFGAFDPELRVTVDGRIQYHPSDFNLRTPFESGRAVLDPRVSVLEIKYDHRAPIWLTKAICRQELRMVRMSKYCSAIDRDRFDGQNT